MRFLARHGSRSAAGAAPLVLVLAAACGPAAETDPRSPADGSPDGRDRRPAAAAVPVEHLRSEATRGAGLPFSDAVRVGDLLFVSGQVGTLPGEMRLAEGGIGPETRQTMENIGAILARHGSSLDRVVKCTAMLADIAEWAAMNEAYTTFFEEGRLPARSAFGASGLALDARVEIECIAATGRGPGP